MSTQAIHEALRLMRIDSDNETARHKLARVAVQQLDALEKEIRKAAKAGTVDGYEVLKAMVGNPLPHFVVAVNERHKVAGWWSVSSEDEGREVALTQSECLGQGKWRIRLYRGDMLLGIWRAGRERSWMHWKSSEKVEEMSHRPSSIGAKKYSVTIFTDTGVRRDTVRVDSEAAAMAYHEAKWKEASYRTCTFRAYEQTPSGQRTLLGAFKGGRQLKK